jgi:hypothetical protein
MAGQTSSVCPYGLDDVPFSLGVLAQIDQRGLPCHRQADPGPTNHAGEADLGGPPQELPICPLRAEMAVIAAFANLDSLLLARLLDEMTEYIHRHRKHDR